MAVRTLTYRDLTSEQRRLGAAQMRERLLGVLNHPFLTDDQRKAISDKIAMLGRWEALAVEIKPVAAPPVASPLQLPVHHDVVVDDTVPAGQKLT
jgi:hypothetical protein